MRLFSFHWMPVLQMRGSKLGMSYSAHTDSEPEMTASGECHMLSRHDETSEGDSVLNDVGTCSSGWE